MERVLGELAATTAIGQLGVLHLKRYWSKAIARREGRLASNSDEHEHRLDAALLSALGLGLEPTIQYLYQATPTFAEFEAWIQTVLGGPPNPAKVALFNQQVVGFPFVQSSNSEAPLTLSADELVHWDTYGYVVIKKAITRQDCDQTIALICDFLSIDRYDSSTWYKAHPGKQGIMVQLFQHALLRRNRESPRIRIAYEQLWGRSDLWVTTDRVGFNPPQTTMWQFPGPYLHWDVDLAKSVPFGTQGLLYLSDTESNQGAFTLVPAFHHQLDDWLARLPPQTNPQTQDLMKLGPISIAASAGDFIIWHHALPHGSGPNTTKEPRFVQYINYSSL